MCKRNIKHLHEAKSFQQHQYQQQQQLTYNILLIDNLLIDFFNLFATAQLYFEIKNINLITTIGDKHYRLLLLLLLQKSEIINIINKLV